MQPRVFRHGLVDSTNERAFAALAEGSARHGDLHVAEGQTGGRGRLGRRWESTPGEGLYLSAILLPDPQGPTPAALTMIAGLATLDAVRGLGAAGAILKWPNDVLVGGAKLCGILVETRNLDPERPHYVVGIGVNVLQRAFPGELTAAREVTSLSLLGIAAGVESALEAVHPRLFARLEQGSRRPDELAGDYLAATGLAGDRVRASSARLEVVGRLEGLGLAEGLTLRLDDGRIERLPLEHVLGLEGARPEERGGHPPHQPL